MDLYDGYKREQKRTFALAIVMALAISVFAAPAAYSAIQSVKARLFDSKGKAIKTTSGAVNTKQQGDVNARLKDTGGGPVDSTAVADMGLFDAPGSTGAIAVRNFAGGGGFLAAVDCSDAVGGANGIPNDTTISGGKIITGLILTGEDAKAKVSSEQLDATLGLPDGDDTNGGPPGPDVDYGVVNLRTNATNPNAFVGLGNGLTTTGPLDIVCTANDGSDNNNAHLVVLGQG